jgi:hypothetical protein
MAREVRFQDTVTSIEADPTIKEKTTSFITTTS